MQSGHYTQYDLRVREQTMYLLHNDPLTLKVSLGTWLTEMMFQATDRALISTRRLEHMQEGHPQEGIRQTYGSE